MLHRLNDLEGLTLDALDGELGHTSDFRFDEELWTVRYLVVRASTWLGRQVLISPISIGQPNWAARTLEVRLTRDRIRNSPEISEIQPLGRDVEMKHAGYYGYPPYWRGPHFWGWAGAPGPLAGPPPLGLPAPQPHERGDGGPLRSVRALRGQHLHARDGEIGHVDDGVIDEESWRIRHLLIDTSSWIGGASVLVPTEQVRDVDWLERRIMIDVTVDRIRSAPEYDPAQPLDRTIEQTLARHYGLDWHERAAPARGSSRGV